MPKAGTAHPSRQMNAAERTQVQMHLLELRGQGWSWKKCCAEAKIAKRTYQSWRQKDEKFALMCSVADGDRTATLVDETLELARDPEFPAAQRAWLYMFHIKQADPSYRDNHKVEHVVSGSLAANLKALTKIGRSA